MINRVLIRIRVLQILFACRINGTTDTKKAENELIFSLQKSYDLYFYLLTLLIELTDTYAHRVDSRRSRLLPSEEDMNPNTKLLNNRFIKQLRENKDLDECLGNRPYDWGEHDVFIRVLLDTILSSDVYKEYTLSQVDDYDTDREFWRKVFKHIICNTEELYSILEDDSLFWNDDVEIVESFVIKTIKKFEESDGENQRLLPMFKDESDREYAVKLLSEAMKYEKEYQELIDKFTANWESERIAIMDMVIMQIALAEIVAFPSIPISVSLNEYIDIAKSYSTAKSSSFINGILDAVVKELKEEKKIIKK